MNLILLGFEVVLHDSKARKLRFDLKLFDNILSQVTDLRQLNKESGYVDFQEEISCDLFHYSGHIFIFLVEQDQLGRVPGLQKIVELLFVVEQLVEIRQHFC